jgi:hypothetical protein
MGNLIDKDKQTGLQETLMHEARVKGICIDGFKEMRNLQDKSRLVGYYMKTLDWSLERDFPTLAFLRENFKDQEGNGVYIDKKFHGEEFSSLQAYVFHSCSGVIKVAMDYKNAVIPMLYFANDCHMTVICEQENLRPIRVPLYVYGDNTVVATNNDNVAFIVYKEERKM